MRGRISVRPTAGAIGMGLLDGQIAALFGQIFSAIYLDGSIVSALTVPIYDMEGNITGYEGGDPTPCKVQIDAASHSMRQSEGFADGDVRLIVLSHGIPVELSTDHRIMAQGQTWMIASVERDPAASHWICRGRRA